MLVLTNIMVKLGYDGIGRRASDGNVYHGAECRDAPRNKVMMIYGFESRYPNYNGPVVKLVDTPGLRLGAP